MIKLIEANTLHELEQFTQNWIDDNTNDKREIVVRSSQVIPLNIVDGVALNGQPRVKTKFCNWMVYSYRFSVAP